jgi:hypothetical protein
MGTNHFKVKVGWGNTGKVWEYPDWVWLYHFSNFNSKLPSETERTFQVYLMIQ